MLKYIVKRIALAIVTIWAVATLTFFLMNMVPGGPFLSEKAISPQATAALEAKYGLDKPLGEQYVTYFLGSSRRFWRQFKTERAYRRRYHSGEVPGICKDWWDFCIGFPDTWGTAWKYRCFEAWQVPR